MRKRITRRAVYMLAFVLTAAAAPAEASAKAKETPWYLSDGLSAEDIAIIGIEEGGEYPSGEKINFYAAGTDNNTSILHPDTPAYEPDKYEITGTDSTGGRCEYREREFDRETHVIGTIPALEPGEYTLKVFFRRRVQGALNTGYVGEDITKELLFHIVGEKEQEEEILSVEIDSFLLDDAHIRAADLIAKELGMRLKIHGATDNTGKGAEYDKVDEMLQEGKADIAVGHTYCYDSMTEWNHDLACSKTYLPTYVIYAKEGRGIEKPEDLAGKNVYVKEWGELLGGSGIWHDFWDSIEGETVYYDMTLDDLEAALPQGNVDAVVMEEYDAWEICDELIQEWGFRLLPETVLDNGYKVAASWENEALIERIDQAIDRLEERGELQKIRDMHFGWKLL